MCKPLLTSTACRWNLWNFVLKLFYLISSAYIVFLMVRVFPRTREKEYGWKLALWSLAGCLVTAPLIDLVIRGWQKTTFTEVSHSNIRRISS